MVLPNIAAAVATVAAHQPARPTVNLKPDIQSKVARPIRAFNHDAPSLVALWERVESAVQDACFHGLRAQAAAIRERPAVLPAVVSLWRLPPRAAWVLRR
jgi:hypothetical protein